MSGPLRSEISIDREYELKKLEKSSFLTVMKAAKLQQEETDLKMMQNFFDSQSAQLDSIKSGLMERASNFSLNEIQSKYKELLDLNLNHYQSKYDVWKEANSKLADITIDRLDEYSKYQIISANKVNDTKESTTKYLDSNLSTFNSAVQNDLFNENEEVKSYLLEESQTLKLTSQSYYDDFYKMVVQLLSEYSKNIEHKQKEYEERRKRNGDLEFNIKDTNKRLANLGKQVKVEQRMIEDLRDTISSHEFLLKKDKQLLTDKYLKMRRENNKILEHEKAKFAELSNITQDSIATVTELRDSLLKMYNRSSNGKLLADSFLLELKRTKQNLIVENGDLLSKFKSKVNNSHLIDGQVVEKDLICVNFK
eukprot:NODE_168_length_16247_cov_0.199591.p5 type:complete len:366 gc:universal NODE_168_length_16247_cov_0.199591:5469-6566(+)